MEAKKTIDSISQKHKQNVVIITRRFSINKGLGTNSLDIEKHRIVEDYLENNSIYWFWYYILLEKNPIYKNTYTKTIFPKELFDGYLDDFLHPLNRKQIKFEHLCKLAEIVDKVITYPFAQITGKDYLHLTHLIEPKLLNNNRSYVFIYSHFPDKQGIDPRRKMFFLSALKNEVKKHLVNEGNDIEFKFNWLIHDSDIVSDTYNGELLIDGEILYPFQYEDIIKEDTIEMVDKKIHEVRENFKNTYIPHDLKRDNIWCFIHEENSYYYKNIILSDIKLSANEICDKLTLNSDEIKRNVNLLKKIGLSDSALDSSVKEFIIQRRGIPSYLEDKTNFNDILNAIKNRE